MSIVVTVDPATFSVIFAHDLNEEVARLDRVADGILPGVRLYTHHVASCRSESTGERCRRSQFVELDDKTLERTKARRSP